MDNKVFPDLAIDSIDVALCYLDQLKLYATCYN